MKLSKKDIGKILQVTFWDHLITNADPDIVECVVIGEAVDITPVKITLRYWKCIDQEDNDEFVCIIRSTVRTVNELLPVTSKK